MKATMNATLGWIVGGLLASGAFVLLSGCTALQSPPTSAPSPSLSPPPGEPGEGQPLFDTDTDACNAMVSAAKAMDHDQVHRLLGPAWTELISGDKVEDAAAFKEFADRAAEQMRIEKQGEATAILHVGKDDWAFPIPATRTAAGKWFFDTEAGKSELLARRIGRDELEAIQICKVYVGAQREYASQDRDDTDVLKYAQHILSTPGKHDGLYWKAAAGEEQSPLARLIAEEKLEGYDPTPGQHSVYHGYRYRVLKRQGAHAPGGLYDYIINGNMVAGFALVAFPAKYEASGIMTFIVNQRGKVYQKDLGPDTTEIARHMSEYDPDGSWSLVSN